MAKKTGGSRRKGGILPIGHAEEIPRPQGEWEPLREGVEKEVSLARASTREAMRDRLRAAALCLDEAEAWLSPPDRPAGSSLPDGTRRSEGVAKSAMRDALVAMAEVWLGLPGPQALELMRGLLAQSGTLAGD